MSLGKHIQTHKIQSPIIIYIAGISAHRIIRHMWKVGVDGVDKCAITLVDVKQIRFNKIIADIEVHKTIGVDIKGSNAQTISFLKYTCLFANFSKLPLTHILKQSIRFFRKFRSSIPYDGPVIELFEAHIIDEL